MIVERFTIATKTNRTAARCNLQRKFGKGERLRRYRNEEIQSKEK